MLCSWRSPDVTRCALSRRWWTCFWICFNWMLLVLPNQATHRASYKQSWRLAKGKHFCFPKPILSERTSFSKERPGRICSSIQILDFRTFGAPLLELPFKAAAVVPYNFWKEGDKDQKLEMMMQDYLKVFREIMRDPPWHAGRTILTLSFVPFLMTLAIVW